MLFPLKTSVVAREIDGELLLHDQRSGNVHRLNSAAAVVWHLCDGSRDAETIASDLGATFGILSADVTRDVNEILTRFTDSGLIEWRAGGDER